MCATHNVVKIEDGFGIVMECQDCGVAVAEFEWIGGELVDTQYLSHPINEEVDDETE